MELTMEGIVRCVALVAVFVGAVVGEDCTLPAAYYDDSCSCASKFENSGVDDIEDAIIKCGGHDDSMDCETITCAFEKLNFIKDGKIDHDIIISSLAEDIEKIPEMRALIGKMEEKCVDNLDKFAPSITCLPLKMLTCFQHTLISECPDDVRANTKECDEVKAFVDKCPMLM